MNNVNWQEDVNGQPLPAGPIDDLQYVAGEEEFVVLSEFDIWKYSLKTQKITCLSDNGDLPKNTRYSLNKWSADSVYIDWKNTYAKGFNIQTKSSSIFTFDDHNGHIDF